jgi:hypothetical protein
MNQFHRLVKTPGKHHDISEVTILSHNIVVNPKQLERINPLTGMDIYGLRVGGLTMVVYSSSVSYFQSKLFIRISKGCNFN